MTWRLATNSCVAVLVAFVHLTGCSLSDSRDVAQTIENQLLATFKEAHRSVPEGSLVAISDGGYKQMVDDDLFSLLDGDIGRENWTAAGKSLFHGVEVNSDDCLIVVRSNDRIANCALVVPEVKIVVTLNEDMAFPREGKVAPIYFSMSYDAPPSIAKYLVQGARGTATVTRLNGEFVVSGITEFAYVDPSDEGRLQGTYFSKQ